MRLGGEMHQHIGTEAANDVPHLTGVADVGVGEAIALVRGNTGEIV